MPDEEDSLLAEIARSAAPDRALRHVATFISTIGARTSYLHLLLENPGVMRLLVRLFAVPGIHDTQCGFKLFQGDVARDLFRQARVDGFAYDMEILFLARRRNIPIAEVPVLWFNSPESKVSLFRDALPTLWDLIRLRWIHRRS